MTILTDHKVNNLWVKSKRINGEKYFTKAGQTWNGIKRRCLVGGAEQRNTPTYTGCHISTEFLDFQLFTNWLVLQAGYNEDGYHLDKDLLVKGNKEYNSNVCVLIPPSLNSFILTCDATRGKWPIGVCYEKQRNKFKAGIKINGKSINLGIYSTPEMAYESYKTAKENEARRWHKRLLSGEFKVDKRVTERMRTWSLDAIDATLHPSNERTT